MIERENRLRARLTDGSEHFLELGDTSAEEMLKRLTQLQPPPDEWIPTENGAIRSAHVIALEVRSEVQARTLR